MYQRFRLPSFTFWQRIIRLFLFFYFAWLIRADVDAFATGVWQFFNNGYVISYQLFNSAFWLFVLFFILVIVYLSYIYWFAQFIFPVTLLNDRENAFKRLFIFSISFGHWHGPAVFVRDGKIIGDPNEVKKNKPGVAFIDLRSAITLDKNIRDKRDLLPASLEKPQKLHFDSSSKKYISGIRVAGPGIAFIKGHEQITGAVDLRNQSRSRSNVYADTRDGIQVKTSVSCTFTLGQPPDILDVCQVDKDTKRVMVIEWDYSLPLGYRRIKGLSDELHEGDEKEIISFIKNLSSPTTFHSDVPSGDFPYTFTSKRVEDAVYYETSVQDPRSVGNQLFKKWSDWPQDVVAQKFRIMLAQWPYMNLYTPEDPDNFPLDDFQKELFKQVRNTGVLAYRFVALQNGSSPQINQVYRTTELIFYAPRALTRFDVLRYRGIKVLSAGIGELHPKEDDVRIRLKDYWLSAKQKEADMKSADYNLEEARIRNQARIRTQQNMIYHLTQLLENQEYPREALALLIYQELEAAAANPETRKLLPADTLSLLTGIGTILLPPDKGTGKLAGGFPIVPKDDNGQ